MEHMPVRINVVMQAPVSAVWTALTSADSMKNWYFNIPGFVAEEGKQFDFFAPEGDQPYHHRGEILKVVPHQKLKHTWTYPDLSDASSVVTWDLVAEDQGATRVFLTHEGVEAFSDLGTDFTRESFLGGWTEIVNNALKQYVEKQQA